MGKNLLKKTAQSARRLLTSLTSQVTPRVGSDPDPTGRWGLSRRGRGTPPTGTLLLPYTPSYVEPCTGPPCKLRHFSQSKLLPNRIQKTAGGKKGKTPTKMFFRAGHNTTQNNTDLPPPPRPARSKPIFVWCLLSSAMALLSVSLVFCGGGLGLGGLTFFSEPATKCPPKTGADPPPEEGGGGSQTLPHPPGVAASPTQPGLI